MSGARLTPTTIQAQRKVFQLLEDNFDAGQGQFLQGYDDERIAKETGISVHTVKEYRVNAFGKIKPPSEIALLRRQIDELETLFLKTETEIREGIKAANQRLLALQRKYD